MMTTDHRTDIRAYAQDLEEDMRAVLSMGAEDSSWEQVARLEGKGIGVNEGVDQYDWFDSWALAVEHAAHGSFMDFGAGDLSAHVRPLSPEETRILIACNGPTVWVVYSHRYGSAELRHSWGREPYSDTRDAGPGEEPDRATWHLDADLVEEFVATFCPHPLEGGE